MKFLRIDEMDSVIDRMLRAAGHEVEYSLPESREALISKLREGFGGLILRSRFRIDGELMRACPGLKLVARAGAGMESIDKASALALGIHCINSPEGNRDAVGEHCVGMLLSILKKIRPAHEAIGMGIWDRKTYTGSDLRSQVVGIIGLGNMGTAFAERLVGFRVRMMAFDPYKETDWPDYVERVGWQKLKEEATVISLHVPYTEETHALIDEEWIESMRNPFYLLNTSRGKVVDTNALVNGLKWGKVLGAGLDVLDLESHNFQIDSERFPEVHRYLCGHPGVVLTPHTAGITPESLRGISEVLGRKILDLLKSESIRP